MDVLGAESPKFNRVRASAAGQTAHYARVGEIVGHPDEQKDINNVTFHPAISRCQLLLYLVSQCFVWIYTVVLLKNVFLDVRVCLHVMTNYSDERALVQYLPFNRLLLLDSRHIQTKRADCDITLVSDTVFFRRYKFLGEQFVVFPDLAWTAVTHVKMKEETA